MLELHGGVLVLVVMKFDLNATVGIIFVHLILIIMTSPVTETMRLNKRLREDITPESIVDFGNNYLAQRGSEERVQQDQQSTLMALDACVNAGVPLILFHSLVRDPERDAFVG